MKLLSSIGPDFSCKRKHATYVRATFLDLHYSVWYNSTHAGQRRKNMVNALLEDVGGKRAVVMIQ